MQRKRKGNDRQAYQSHIKRQEAYPKEAGWMTEVSGLWRGRQPMIQKKWQAL